MVVYSKATINEFVETLIRPKFDKYLSIETRIKAISIFEQASQLVDVSLVINACRDPKDNKFLELAAEVGAGCIVTGDKDLLVLHPFQNTPILTASDFLANFNI